MLYIMFVYNNIHRDRFEIELIVVVVPILRYYMHEYYVRIIC